MSDFERESPPNTVRAPGLSAAELRSHQPSAQPTAALEGQPQRILVLGATSGIAEATCRIWADQGARLLLVARNEEKLDAVAADLRLRGAAVVEIAVADLNDTSGHAALLKSATARLDGLDVAYIAYGLLGEQSVAQHDFRAAQQIIQTNFISAVSLLTWLADYCLQQKAGVLAVISSVAGERGRRSNYVYGASKAGLSVFLEGLRNRVDRAGVTVLTIKPGPVKTAMTAAMPGSHKFADVNKVAAVIVRAIATRKDIVYVPFQWGPIMFVIRHLPESLFKKLNL